MGKSSEKKTGKKFLNIGLGNDFLDTTQKPQTTEAKIKQ